MQHVGTRDLGNIYVSADTQDSLKINKIKYPEQVAGYLIGQENDPAFLESNTYLKPL